MNQLSKDIIKQAARQVDSLDDLNKVKSKVCKEKGQDFPSNIELLRAYRGLLKNSEIKKDKALEGLLVKRDIRTISGVAPVAIFTRPNSCPGDCAFCPTQAEVPKSYLDNEPAVMRAIRNDYDPVKQVWDRLQALYNEGHPIDKVELIVMGGSFSSYGSNYKKSFFRKAFWAANSFRPNLNSKMKDKEEKVDKADKEEKEQFEKYEEDISSSSLTNLQAENEQAKVRLVGVSVETRPDLIDKKELKLWRRLGVTRVEIGVQSVFDEVLKKNNRGHGAKESIRATYLLKEAGFKVIYHMMPGLPGSSLERGLESFRTIFNDPKFMPDQIKIYPCVVTEGSQIYDWHKSGKFKPIAGERLKKLILEIKKIVPYWVRIIRVVRDIPSQSIVAGNKISNLRQLLKNELKEKDFNCKCIRCREVKKEVKDEQLKLFKEEYQSSKGKEVFFSLEDEDRQRLYGILRLRVPSKNSDKLFPVLKQAGLVRELHTYGTMVPVEEKEQEAAQHKGVGRRLMEEAEKYIKENTNLDKITVISGVGVRGYYRKLGYRLKNSYMVKEVS